MNIIEKVKDYVKTRSIEYKNNSLDHYDFWNEHIKYVYDESLKLADKYGADKEIVALGALLPDIALVNKVGDKKNHHINGKIIAKEVLSRFGYDKNKLEKVLKCVYNHRSSKNAESIEEVCVADADILAHFKNIPMLFDLAYNKFNLSLNDVRPWIKKSLEKDYNDLSERTKKKFEKEYKLIEKIVIGK